MSVLRAIHSRQTQLSGGNLSSQRWIFEEHLECNYEDEVGLHGRLRGDSAPSFACKFTRDGLHGHLLAVADEDGSVRLFDTRKRLSESSVSEVVCHNNAIFDISWLPGGNKLLTGSGDHTVRLWDVVSGARLENFHFHSSSVKSVDCNKDEPSVFASGCRNGSICIWDMRCTARASGHRPVNTIAMSHVTSNTGVGKKRRSESTLGVTSVLFQAGNKLASAGSGDGSVKLWDTRRTYSTKSRMPSPWQTFEPVERPGGKTCGFTSLVLDSRQSFIFATCRDDNIYKYSTTGLITRPVDVYVGSDVSSFYVKSCLSPDDKFLLSGSSDGNAFIWEIDHPEAPPLLLSSTRHCNEITAVDWCPSMDKMVTCSDENDVRLWRVNRTKDATNNMQWRVTGSCFEDPREDHLKAKDIIESYKRDRGKDGATTTASAKKTKLNITPVSTRIPQQRKSRSAASHRSKGERRTPTGRTPTGRTPTGREQSSGQSSIGTYFKSPKSLINIF